MAYLIQRLGIWQVGDCGTQDFQVIINLEHSTTVEFTTISSICYIHCSTQYLYSSTISIPVLIEFSDDLLSEIIFSPSLRMNIGNPFVKISLSLVKEG